MGRLNAHWPARIWPWVPALGVATTIFVLSSLPGSAFPAIGFSFADKLAHATLYAALGALVAWPLHRLGWARSALGLIGLTACMAGAYGLSDELHQLYTPLRSADAWDVVADAVGALIGAAGYVGVSRLRASRAS